MVFPHHPEVLEAKRVSKAEDLLEKASGDKKVIKALKPKPKTARGRPRGGGQGGNGKGDKNSKTEIPNDGVEESELPSAASAAPTATPETDVDEKMVAKWKEIEPRLCWIGLMKFWNWFIDETLVF